ncbi:hypothetical protein JNJ66_04100 [Candidatus Saccharibacteria bacterium]|nr:hypothetical protein [Candidatus Saccharibacteria bacterium]
MANTIGDGTAAGAVEYLDSIVSKGRATNGAIQPLKIAFTKVVSAVDGPQWGDTKIQDIDPGDYMARFGNLTRGTYTDQSLTAYRSRVSRVVEWYKLFMERPGWMPEIQTRSPRVSASKPTTPEAIPVRDGEVHSSQPAPQAAMVPSIPMATPVMPQGALIAFPFPLGGGTLATLNLPSSITRSDAERLSAFVQTLVVETQDKQD